MNKKTKITLGLLFIAAGVGLYIINRNKDKEVKTCKEGETPCPNNPSICFNPNARYKEDPCGTPKPTDFAEEPQYDESGNLVNPVPRPHF